jgi:hypothetical protein
VLANNNNRNTYLLLLLPLPAAVVEGLARGVHLHADALLGLLPHRQRHVDRVRQLALLLHRSLARGGVLLDAQLQMSKRKSKRNVKSSKQKALSSLGQICKQ